MTSIQSLLNTKRASFLMTSHVRSALLNLVQEEGGAYYSHNVGMSQPSFTTFLRPLTYAIPIAITFASAAVEAQKVKAIKRGRARKCYYMFGFMKYCPNFYFFISVQ